MTPRLFTLNVPDADIADLKARLAGTRWPDQAPGEPWAYGTSVAYAQELAAYWRDKFDWRAQEAALNAFPQFKVALHGIDLHYLHVPGKGLNPKPLLLLHGWPGSVFEFIDIISRLADPAAFGGDPADAFTVVAPSLPGYGLSFTPGQKRFSLPEVAACTNDLMTKVLGYSNYAVQGGDWGAATASLIGQMYPGDVCGIHINLLFIPLDRPTGALTAEEVRYDNELMHWLKEEIGYQQIQGTKPQTLSFGLSDSPAGLAAWIAEKFRKWSDCDGVIENAITRDRMLGNISLYWFTGAIGSSFWPYYTRIHDAWPLHPGNPVTAPTGYAEFPRENRHPPRSLASKTYTNIQRWTEMKKGGHFAAMEQPADLAAEIQAFFRSLR